MKFNIVMHVLGIVGAIVGAIGMYHTQPWYIWQWPLIALVWIVTSLINVAFSNHQLGIIERLDKERIEMIEQNIKLETRLWDAEMKLAKADKK